MPAKKGKQKEVGLPLKEYLHSIKKPEMRRAFQVKLESHSLHIGLKGRTEWDAIYEVFVGMPVGADLKELLKKGRK